MVWDLDKLFAVSTIGLKNRVLIPFSVDFEQTTDRHVCIWLEMNLKCLTIYTLKSLLEDALLFNSQILERASIQGFQNFM